MQLDPNATSFIVRAIDKHSECAYIDVELDRIGHMYVQWRNKKTISEMVEDNQLDEHERSEKIMRIARAKDSALKNIFTCTTIFGMRSDHNSPIVIFDGIHRSIGIYRAYMEDPDIQRRTSVKMLLFEGDNFKTVDDYILSIR